MNKLLGCWRQREDVYFTLQPGLPLSSLRKMIAGKTVPTQGWSAQSQKSRGAKAAPAEKLPIISDIFPGFSPPAPR
jgi:hypothetical protein